MHQGCVSRKIEIVKFEELSLKCALILSWAVIVRYSIRQIICSNSILAVLCPSFTAVLANMIKYVPTRPSQISK
jgi:hypothetical protein